MFWPIILPLQLTCGFLVIATLAGVLLLRVRRWRPWRIVGCVVLFWLLGFVPALLLIGKITDLVRFGDFHYADYAAVKNARVYRYLPRAASDISMRKEISGFVARFRITQSELEAFVTNAWRPPVADSLAGKRSVANGSRATCSDFGQYFTPLPWGCPKDALVYYGPSAANGGGFVVYFSPAEQLAYMHAGYW